MEDGACFTSMQRPTLLLISTCDAETHCSQNGGLKMENFGA